MHDLLAMFRHPSHRKTALKVSLVVGSVLFCINHGHAVLTGKMTRARWASGLLTYGVPFMVSLHGQAQGLKRIQSLQSSPPERSGFSRTLTPSRSDGAR